MVEDIGLERTPLLAALARHAGEGYISFHTPGHKQGAGAFTEWHSLLGDMVFQLDLTELPGLDNLQDPQGVIAEAQARAAAYFGAAETFFLVNGATAGILAVMLAASGPGKKVVLPRVSHQSVFNGLILSGARPVYLPVEYSPDLGLLGQVETCRLERVLTELDNEEKPLLVLLHPNYYGLAGDLCQQVKTAHEQGCVVLVDEAHGAHFVTSALFPVTALQAGADFAAQGAHKVLGAFTQAAFLHCREEGDQRIRDALRLVQSSSPSYLLMASLDVARCQCEQEEEQWEAVAQLGHKLRSEISRLPGLFAPGNELFELPGVYEYDPSRLIVNVSELGITGFEAADWLYSQKRILVEMADLYNVVLILSPASLESADLLIDGFSSLAAACSTSRKNPSLPDFRGLPLPQQLLTPREAFFADFSLVPWDSALGKISAELISPYPPGVPVLCPGERIDGEVLEFLHEWERAGGSWPGQKKGLIRIVVGS
ncbi:MAG: aminotransferase class I/II-fold pyridoxal phosphate-dependent enzyme [Thermacetogeniaceae bacterium]|nr:aminotransferase class I/II-fold pyridoxal phosphate-dependent enzyme [Syntrophomonadaceae bacterium]